MSYLLRIDWMNCDILPGSEEITFSPRVWERAFGREDMDQTTQDRKVIIAYLDRLGITLGLVYCNPTILNSNKTNNLCEELQSV
jgi:hypothetical protein